MPGRTCVSCVNQRAGASGSLAIIAADCANADCNDAKSGGVKRGSTTKSAPKIVAHQRGEVGRLRGCDDDSGSLIESLLQQLRSPTPPGLRGRRRLQCWSAESIPPRRRSWRASSAAAYGIGHAGQSSRCGVKRVEIVLQAGDARRWRARAGRRDRRHLRRLPAVDLGHGHVLRRQRPCRTHQRAQRFR